MREPLDDGKGGDLREQYPGNSKYSRARRDMEEKGRRVKKVVSGKAWKHKPGFGKKLAETFLADEARNVAGYVLHDVIVPTAKKLVSEAIAGGLDMLLYGRRRNDGARSGGKGYTSYGSHYRGADVSRDIPRASRARHDFESIVLDTRGEAEDVLEHLVEIIDAYGEATVADLYDLVGVTSSFTDNKYGWTDLRSASASRVRDGYLLDLPRTRLLD